MIGCKALAEVRAFLLVNRSIVEVGDDIVPVHAAVIDKCGPVSCYVDRVTEEVELEAQNGQLVIRPVSTVRQGWEAEFQQMAAGDDQLIDGDFPLTKWEAAEWGITHTATASTSAITSFNTGLFLK